MGFGNEYVDDYGTCEATYASLRFVGAVDLPERITTLLRIEPTSMRVLGKVGLWREGGWRGLDSDRVSKHSSWIHSSQGVVESRDSLRHIDYLLELLDGKDAEMASLLQAGWRADISVYWHSKWGHGGPTLTPGTMGRLAELGLTIWFDVYDSDPDREPEEVEGHPGWYRIGV